MSQLCKIQNRDVLGEYLNATGLTGEMAEIGVAHGGFAKIVLATWRGKRYHMVDLFTAQDPSIYKERQEEAWKYGHWHKEALELAEKYPCVNVIKGDSSESAGLFKDGQLDCVFIDANHDFDPVMRDIIAWYPKVKSGGIFSGHDFYNSTTTDGHWCLVKDAVEQWSKKTGAPFATTPCESWWVIKP